MKNLTHQKSYEYRQMQRSVQRSIIAILLSLCYSAAYLTEGTLRAELDIFPDLIGFAAIIAGLVAIGTVVTRLSGKKAQLAPKQASILVRLAVAVCLTGSTVYFGTTPVADWVFMHSSGNQIESWAQSELRRYGTHLTFPDDHVNLWEGYARSNRVSLPGYVSSMHPGAIYIMLLPGSNINSIYPTLVIRGGGGFSHYELDVQPADDPVEFSSIPFHRKLAPCMYLIRAL